MHDCTHGIFGQITRMAGYCGTCAGLGIPPYLVAAFGLQIEYEACAAQLPDDLPGGQSCKSGRYPTLTGM